MATLFEHAASLHTNGELDAAEKIYRQILSENPKHANAYCNLGIIKKSKGLNEDAIVILEKALSLNANLPAAVHNLAVLYFSKSNWLEALKHFNTLTKFDQNSIFAYANLALCFTYIGRPDDAITCYYKSLEIAPSAILYINLTECILQNNKVSEFAKAIEIGRSIVDNQTEENKEIIQINNHSLSFEMIKRRIKYLQITKERPYSESSNTNEQDQEKIDEIYPIPFIKELSAIDESTDLLSKGFLIKDHLISQESSSRMLDFMNKSKSSIILNHDLLDIAYSEGIVKAALENINLETGTQNIVWNFLGIRNFSSKLKPDRDFMATDERAGKSELWHIDHNYNKWNQKCLIFLEKDLDNESSADFCDFAYTTNFTKLTRYKGWKIEKKYSELVSAHATELKLDTHTLEPPYTQLSVDHPGQALLYCPGRILHRVPIPYVKDRMYLSFSFTSLPPSSNLTTDFCLKKSIDILRKKCHPNLINVDDMPAWV